MPEIKSAVPYFTNPEDAKKALEAKNNYLPVSLYPRDGTEKLHELEVKLAELTRMEAGEVLAFGSGMQAVIGAIELANPTKDDVVYFAEPLYSQSMNYQEILRERQVDVRNRDIESTDSFVKMIQKNKPKLIFAETVNNTPDAFALEIEKLLDMPLEEGWDPLIVLDPTMTTPSGRNLGELMASTDKRVITVESGTKNYMLNTDLIGLAYSKRRDIMQKLRERRRTGGNIPGISLTNHALNVLPSLENFDERNRAILRNNMVFAETLSGELNEGAPFLVGHPNLPKHANYNYVAQHYPKGATQATFITDQRKGQLNGDDLLKELFSEADEAVHLGQSFGFDTTRLWFDSYVPANRISAGTEPEEAIKALALKWAKKLNTL